MKVFVAGVFGAVLFMMLGQGAAGYVYHTQVKDVDSDDIITDLGFIDLVRRGMDEFDDDIVVGHGCTPAKGYMGDCPFPYGGLVVDHIAINLYSSLQVISNNYVLKDGDEVCTDDVVEAKREPDGGEWFVKGGPADSPPIQWMSCAELKDFLVRLVEWHKTNIYPDEYRKDMSRADSYVVDNYVVKRDDIIVYSTGLYHQKWFSYLSILCCHDDETSLTETKDNDVYVYDVNSKPRCIMYIDSFSRGKYMAVFKPMLFERRRSIYEAYNKPKNDYFTNMSWIDEYFETSLFDFSHSKRVSQISPLAKGGPTIEMIEYDLESSLYEYDPLYVRVQIENTGDMKLHVDGVSLNVDEFEVIYAPKSLDAGNKSEIVIETTARDISSLELSIEYFSDKLGCLNTKDFSVDFSLGSVSVKERPFCKETGDCAATGMDNAACCRGLCYDLSRGSCDDYDGDGHFEWSYY